MFRRTEAPGGSRKLRYVQHKRNELSFGLPALAQNDYAANAPFGSYLIRAGMKPDVLVENFAATFFGCRLRASTMAPRAISATDRNFNLNKAAIDSPLLAWSLAHGHQRPPVTILDDINRTIDPHPRGLPALEQVFTAPLRKLMAGRVAVDDFDFPAIHTSEQPTGWLHCTTERA